MSALPSLRASAEAPEHFKFSTTFQAMDQRFADLRRMSSVPKIIESVDLPSTQASGLSAELFEARGRFKIDVANVAMHLGKEWRDRLFRQYDRLLDIDEWDEADSPPTDESARTFIRLLLLISPPKKPAIALGNSGNLVASWGSGDNSLVIDCRSRDHLRFYIARVIDGEREVANGKTTLGRLKEVLAAYRPEAWFTGAE